MRRLNWLRAGVLGANDGIVSVAAVVVGVAGATTATGALVTAGMAAVLGGAVSMALGEYVSVSSQRDSELAHRTSGRQSGEPMQEPMGAAGEPDTEAVASPWHAALASFVSFLLGALLPMIAILLPSPAWRVPVTWAATILALALTGAVAAHIGGSSRRRAALRVVIGGSLALAATYLIGMALGSGLGI